MSVQDLLRKTFTYKYIYLPYRKRQAQEIKQRKYNYLQNNAPGLLKEIVQIFNKEGISLWLEFGTLLGAYRDKAIIKGDFDLDFGAFQKDVARIYSALTKAGFELVREFHEIGRNGLDQSYFNGEVTFDIFYFSEDDSNSYICYGFEPIPNKNIPNKATFGKVHSWSFKKFELTELEFLGVIVSIPSNTEEHLEEIYGINWRIPDPAFGQGFNKCHYDICERKGIGFQYNM